MSNMQKRGFRLPWAAERGSEDDVAAATIDPGLLEKTPDDVRLDLVAGSFRASEAATRTLTRDADPAASNVPDATAEAEMSESQTATAEPLVPEDAAPPNGWPNADRATGPEHARDGERAAALPPIGGAGATRVPRRDNPLVAGLVKAMREAALASREETTARLTGEVTARVESIRSGSTDEAAALRKRADDDIAEIREWSKAEIARVRQQTDDRIEARRVELASETESHTASVERMVEAVQSTVTSFEADMDQFFERLMAENDPARLAALAEQAPSPPDLSDEVAGDWLVDASNEADAKARAKAETKPEAKADAKAETTKADTKADAADESVAAPEAGAADESVAALEAGAAAEAEAEATEGLDMAAATEWPAAVLAAARRVEDAAPDSDGGGLLHGRLLVSGLTSVAAISAFKGAVGTLPGITGVSVSSGDPGVFIFAVSHDPEIDLGAALAAAVPGFTIQITEATGDSLTVTAHEAA